MALDKEKLLDLAQKYIGKGQFKKAIKEYIKLVEVDPKDKRLYLKLGDLYYKSGENEKAITEYLKLASLYAEEDLSFRAISIYKKVLSINPKHIEALKKIAGLYLAEGLGGDAKNFYQSILEMKRDDQEALEAMSSLEIHQQPKTPPKTMPAFELPIPEYLPPLKTIPVDDKSDLYPSSMVQSEIQPKVRLEVQPEIQSEVQSEVQSDVVSGEIDVPPPDKDSEMHYHLGIAYKEMELFDYAISEFELASSSPSMKFDCCMMLGNCFMEKGDYSQAIQSLKNASQVKGLTNERLVRLHFDLGQAYEGNGMLSEAIETFQLVLKLDRSFSQAQEKISKLQQLHK